MTKQYDVIYGNIYLYFYVDLYVTGRQEIRRKTFIKKWLSKQYIIYEY